MYFVSKKDADAAHCNFNADQPILIIYDRRCCWESMENGDLLSHLSELMSFNYLEKHEPRKLCLFTHAAYRVSKTKWLDEK